MKKILLLLSCCLCLGALGIAQPDTRELDLYDAFGHNDRLSFLQGELGKAIFEARISRNVGSLAGYAMLLFHAERLSGTTIEELKGLELLEEATLLAFQDLDAKALAQIAAIWEDSSLGAGNQEEADRIRRELASVSKGSERKIKVIPAWVSIEKNGSVNFYATYADDEGRHIPMEELSFVARQGSFSKNVYRAPNFACRELVEVKHLPSGQVGAAVVVVKGEENISLPSPEKLTPSPYLRNPSKSTTSPLDAWGNGMAQKILLKEEAARLEAQANMVREIKRYLAFLGQTHRAFRQIDEVVSSSETMLLGNIEIGKAYVYKDDFDKKLRVAAKMPVKDAARFVQRHCRRANIEFPQTLQEIFVASYGSETIEVEGAVGLP